MLEEEIILVDENDNEVGFMPKLETHKKGLLHRAFSILIFNKKGELLIHKRANNKYHSSNLWTNTCCSHPRKGETTYEAVHRRLKEEMGFDCKLDYAYKFIYKTELENNLIEHEYDHVFIGEYNDEIHPNFTEVSDYKWISLSNLRNDILQNPKNYTFWFQLIINEHLKSFHFNKKVS